jgi:hypothetical protein
MVMSNLEPTVALSNVSKMFGSTHIASAAWDSEDASGTLKIWIKGFVRIVRTRNSVSNLAEEAFFISLFLLMSLGVIYRCKSY